MRRNLAIFLCFLFWNTLVWGAYVMSGNISTDTTLYMSNNPHQIRGDIRVLDGVTLSIEPGVNIFFEPNSSLTVEGSISAMGSSVMPITFSSLNFANYYTRLIFSSAENSTLNHCSIGRSEDWTGLLRIENSSNINIVNSSLGSSINSHGLYINNSSVNISGLDINNVAGSGVYVSGNSSVVSIVDLFVDGCSSGVRIPNGAYPTLTWNDLTIHHSSSYPIIGNLANLAVLTGLSTAWEGKAMLLFWDSAIYSSLSLPYQSIPYCVESSLSIYNGATLTLSTGTGLRFNNHGALYVGNNSSLIAEGSQILPISFAPASTNTWKGISFAGNSTGSLDYCEFSGCGVPEYGSPEPTINVNGAATISISNTVIPGGTSYGVYWDGSNEAVLNLHNVSIENCPDTGLLIRNSYLSFEYTELTISDCGKPLALPANMFNFLDNAPLLSDNIDNRIFIHIDGSIRRNTTIRNWGYPYVCENLDITTNYIDLVIDPGCEFQMGYSMGFSVNGTISALGTSANPILFTKLPGSSNNWRGFYLNAGTSYAHFDHCILNYCASSNQYNHIQDAFTLYRANTVLIENTQINNAYCRAVCIESSDSDQDDLVINNLSINGCGMDAVYQNASGYNLTISGLTVNACNAYPLSISANWAHQVSGLTLTNNAFNVIRFIGGGYLASQTLSNHGYPYQVSGGNLYVYYTQVTIQPGTIFYLERYRSLEISGTLTAIGSPEQPIIFDRVPSGSYYWDRIYLTNNSNASFAYCQLNNGGERNQYGYDNALLDNDGASLLSLQNCQINNCDAQAIRLTTLSSSDNVQINDLQISGCRTDGIWCNDDDFIFSANNLYISDCLRNPLSIPPAKISAFTQLNLSDNANNDIRLFQGNGIYGNLQFPNFGYVYRCEEGIIGYSGSSVSFAPGTMFWIADNRDLAFYGTVSAVGTETEPITFTRYPSSTNYWGGITLYNSSWEAEFTHCRILYAGAQNAYGERRAFLNSGSANVQISNCLIQHSFGNAIVCTDMQISDILDIDGLSIQEAAWSGFVAANAPDFNLSAFDLEFSGIGTYPINCSADLIDRFNELSFANIGNPYIVISSSSQSRSATWPNFGLPYKINNSFWINNWVTLNLAAGVEIVFADYIQNQVDPYFWVYGALNTLGTSISPVTMRGMNVSSPSTWPGLRITDPDAVCSLNYLVLLNAGLDQNHTPADEFCALYVNNGTVNFTGVQINQSNHNLIKLDGNPTVILQNVELSNATHGIIHNGGSLSLSNCTITGLSGTGIFQNGGSLFFGQNPSEWNRIYDNALNLQNNTQTPLAAPYIYWGSTDPVVVDASICDDEEGNWIVNFEPWYDLSCQNLFSYSLDAPENPELEMISATILMLRWSPVSGASHYRVLASGDPTTADWEVFADNVISCQHEFSLDTDSPNRFFKVQAVR